MFRTMVSGLIALSTMLVMSGPVRADDSSGASEGGILFRIAPGVSYGWALNASVHNVGSDASMALGGFVSQTVAVHVTALGSFVVNPHDGVNPNDEDVLFYGMGIGVTRYSNDYRGYWSVSGFMGTMKLRGRPEDYSSFGVELLTGREWATGERVGLGFGLGAIAYLSTGMPDKQLTITPALRLTMAVH